MGVDARMFVRINRPVTDAELHEWSYRFGSMAQPYLFLGVDERIYHHPLNRIAVYEQDGDDILPEPGETFLSVPLSGRYYGEGYERGPLLTYIGIAEFLEQLIPGCVVWYGGDSSGICAEPFTRTARKGLLKHAANVAHDPYVGSFDGIGQEAVTKRPTCPVCEMPMPRCGFGNDYALFRCAGCGWEEERRGDITARGFRLSERRFTPKAS